MQLVSRFLPNFNRTPDLKMVCLSAFLRAVAVGISGVILALYLTTIGLTPASVGIVISLGLLGSAIGTLLTTLFTDRFGRKKSLVLLNALMVLGGLGLVLMTDHATVMVTVFLGMVNGMGRDRGAGLTIEQAILPQMVTAPQRTTLFAWYNLFVDTGYAIGALFGGVPALLRSEWGLTAVSSYQWTWGLYSGLSFLAGLSVLRISTAIEPIGHAVETPLSSPSRPTIMKFAALSGLDSFGGGFLTTALVGYWFFKRFGVDELLLGPLFFFARIANGLSHLGAAWLASRIGLVNTMVFTHLPSNLLLMAVTFAPNLSFAIAIFLLRELLVEMDVPTRQSYIVAVVKPEERTRATGITNLTRGIAWAVGPMMAGSIMQLSPSVPLLIGPSIKIVYDLLLYRAFSRIKPPEEQDTEIIRKD